MKKLAKALLTFAFVCVSSGSTARAELAITTKSLPNGTVGTAYSQTLTASGGVTPYTWTLTAGALPAGLTLSSSGTISGTPTAAGKANFSVKVTDSSTPTAQSVSQPFSITITGLTITTRNLPNGVAGTAYSQTLTASGGITPLTWTLTAGALPAGLTLSSSGTISGTPTAAGKASFTVKVTDSSTPKPQTVSRPFSISIAGLTITTIYLPNGMVGTAYSQTLTASGGVTPYTWTLTAGALPAGLTLSSSGTISGTPTATGTANFTVKVTDSSTPTPQTASRPLSITITGLTITTLYLPSGLVGTAYSQTLAAIGGITPFTWTLTAGALPAGLTLSSSGTISGTPTTAGTASFTVKVTDSSTPKPQTVSQPLSIAIIGLTITTKWLPNGIVGTAYSQTLAAIGGITPFTWTLTAGALPAGLTLSSSGTISGTPTAAGKANFTVTVTDSSTPTAQTKSQALSIIVNAAPAACTSSGNESVLSGQYAFTLSGYNSIGFQAVAGSFTADGTGKITAGEADTDGVFGAQSAPIIASASSYSVGSDNRGCATIATSFGTFTTRFALGSISGTKATQGRVIEFDSPSPWAYIAAGQILQQDPTSFAAGPSGSYAFGGVGSDSLTSARVGVVGVMTASGGAFTNLEEDSNAGGAVSHITGLTGTYTSFDTYGRATTTFSYLGHVVSTGTLYMVSASNLLYLQSSIQPWYLQLSSPDLIGEIQQQTVPTGGFTDASIDAPAVLYMAGNAGSGSDIVMGIATGNGRGTLAIAEEEDDSGELSAESSLCTYTVASNGRMALTGTGRCSGLLYLTSANTGIALGLTTANATILPVMSNHVDFGQFEPQAAGPFTNASLSGTFFMGDAEVVNRSQTVTVGSVSLDGAGNLSGTSDSTSTTGQDYAAAIKDTYSVNSDGTFSLGSSGATIVGTVISGNQFVMINHVTSPVASVLVANH
jgi:hypothetical protein